MPAVITTCGQCKAQFSWNTDFQEQMPDCPRCGYNPSRRFSQADVPALFEMLQSPDQFTSSGAAAELGRRGYRQAIDPLIAALENPGARLAAVIALGRLRAERAVPALATVAREATGPSISAAEALVAIGTPEAIRAVVDSAGQLHGDAVRAAVAALAAKKGGEGVPPLLALMRSADPFVKRRAAEALAGLGWRPEDPAERVEFYTLAGALDELKGLGASAIEPLRAALAGDGFGGARSNVAKALSALGWTPPEGERVPYLLALGLTDAVAEMGPAVLEQLAAALHDADRSVANDAAQVLGKLGDRRAVEPLIAALQRKPCLIQCRIMEALAALGDPRAVEPLVACLDDPWEYARAAAAEALGELREPRAIEPLTAKLEDPELHVREAAAKALGDIGDPRAIEPLAAAARQPAQEVRYTAIQALLDINDRSALGPLVAALGDSDSTVRMLAAGGLGELGEASAAPRLVAALADSDKWVREEAQGSLAKLGEAALQALQETVNDRAAKPPLRQAAIDTYKKLTGRKPKIKPCFIATAAMGGSEHPSVKLLREFRDECLEPHAWGRALMRLYYRWSPALAGALERHPALRRLARLLLVAPAAAVARALLARRQAGKGGRE